jgi:beta-glucosidase
MPYSIYAEGLYYAIRDVAQLRIPIYITENGIADKTDTKRDLWIKRHFYALHKALQDGFDVRGFLYWSLMDNYEWDMGYTQKFGLSAVDMKTFERTIRPGAQRFITHAQALC